MMANRIRESIDIETKYQIIKLVEKKEKYASIMKQFNLKNKANISVIVKQKEEIIKAFEERSNSKRKSLKTTTYEDVEQNLLQFVGLCNNNNLPINGPIIKEKAKDIASRIGHSNFEASNGWLSRFCKRNSVHFKVIHGESGSVCQDTTNEWINSKLPSIISDFKLCDIYNADEFGLFFRLKPTKTFIANKSNFIGGKHSKERITILVCCNADGSDKRKLMVIGKSAKPRCFRKIKSLPVIYEANKKAWMTSDIFKNYLLKWNNQLARKNRNILLLIDNCPSHIFNFLSNIKVVFLPKNTTSVLQPCDLGIIKCIKGRYRLLMMKKLIANFEISRNEKYIDILDGIYMIASAWNDINISTIQNCFIKAGIITETIALEEYADEPDGWNFLIEQSDVEIEKDMFITFDDNLKTSDDDFNIIVENDNDNDVNKESDEEDIIEEKITTKEALLAIDKLKKYFCNFENCELSLCDVIKVEKSIIKHCIDNLKQSKITFINKH